MHPARELIRFTSTCVLASFLLLPAWQARVAKADHCAHYGEASGDAGLLDFSEIKREARRRAGLAPANG